MSRRDAIIASLASVPPLPAAVQRTLALLRDPEAEMEDIARAIELDPNITANVLRLANSPQFGGMRAVGTVREALIRLGAKRVGQLIMAAGVSPHVSKEIKGYGLSAGALLEHSIATALAAEALARKIGRTPPEHTFTAGLLANLGKVVLGTFLEVDATPILELAHSEMIPFDQAEERILGINHAEVGALLLERWGLPEEIVEIVRWRLTPDDYPGENLALDLVHAGEALAKLSSIALGVDGLHYHPSTLVVQRLDLTPEIVEQVMAQVAVDAAELSQSFATDG
jgi:putative nucleotidyltransferase with HDIG domain